MSGPLLVATAIVPTRLGPGVRFDRFLRAAPDFLRAAQFGLAILFLGWLATMGPISFHDREASSREAAIGELLSIFELQARSAAADAAVVTGEPAATE